MKINKKVFIPTISFIFIVLILVVFNLSAVQNSVNYIYKYLSHNFSWLFILSNIAALIFSFYIIFGPYAKVKLGGDKSKPEYSNFSWIAMIFTTSCSAGLIVFGFIESIIYASAPPFQITPFSTKAYEYAQVYSHYHWGLNAWSLYVPATIAIGYMFYNKKSKNITMSSACEPVLKNKKFKTLWSSIIDVFSTFGAVVAPVTSMGLGMPLLTLLIQNIFNISNQYVQTIQIIILAIWVIMFTSSVYLGLKKGIKRLSDTNVIMAFLFMIFIGILAGVFNILKAEVNTIGIYLQEFIHMVTYTDPYGNGDFVANWTVWYWAWLIVYMPLMGVFNARISKGRTLRQITIAQMLGCSMGCWFAMATLGNYAIQLQQTGVNIAGVLNAAGQPEAILAIINAMPYPKLIMFLVATLCFIFMATTMDSSAFVAAETTMVHEKQDELAPRWSRVMWAAVACIITFVLLQVGGFNAVQVLAILIGFPLAILMFIIIYSAIKVLREDHRKKLKFK